MTSSSFFVSENRYMVLVYKYVNTLIFVVSFVFIMFDDTSVLSLANIHFYLLSLLLLCDFFKKRSLTLYQVWIVAFIYIILSEMLLYDANIRASEDMRAVRFLLIANDLVLIGYLISPMRYRMRKMHTYVQIRRKQSIFLFFLMVCYVYYLYKELPLAFINYFLGRQFVDALGSSQLDFAIAEAIGMILPSIIAFYIVQIRKSKVIYSIVYSFPIFIVMLLLGTRFKFLFSILPFLLVANLLQVREVNFKKMVFLFGFALLFICFSSFLKTNRDHNYAGISFKNGSFDDERNVELFSAKLAREMSPEGIVGMTKLAEDYFSKNPHTYGVQSSFILYFWIPRSFWPNKPTLLDYWLIRKYEKTSPAYTTSSGFVGELRADFGMFSLICVFFLGMILKYLESYVDVVWNKRYGSFDLIFAAMLYPMTFFFVRSPIVSIYTFIFQYVIYIFFRRLFVVKINRKKYECFSTSDSLKN